MQIVVTGACGFIGSVLCARLSEQGHEVIAVDNGSRGRNDPSGLPHVTLRRQDASAAFLTLPWGSIDACIHLAAKTGSLSYPVEELIQHNATDTVHLFQTAQAKGVRVFIFPTTSLALGVPESSYVISKEHAITALQEAAPSGKTSLHLYRFFNVGGAYRGFTERRLHEVHLLPMLATHVQTQEPFVINGDDYATVDGTPSRDFIHVLDVADYLIYRLTRQLTHAEDPPEAVQCLGRGQPATVQQVIDLVQTHYGPLPTTLGPRRAFDVGELRCPAAHVARLQAWRPLRGLDAIVMDELNALREPAHA
jgi:UDP-glucose 4-epimerase